MNNSILKLPEIVKHTNEQNALILTFIFSIVIILITGFLVSRELHND